MTQQQILSPFEQERVELRLAERDLEIRRKCDPGSTRYYEGLVAKMRRDLKRIGGLQ